MYTFLIPVYLPLENKRGFNFFKQTISSILNQTDSDWSLIMIDDNSRNEELNNYVQGVIDSHSQKIIFHHNEMNIGPGKSRNLGIKLAKELGTSVIMYLDHDDIADLRRVEITKRIFNTTNADLVYSPFKIIDENNDAVPLDKISFSVLDILKAMEPKGPSGNDLWKIIGTETGYVNLLTSTSVKIEYSLDTPFPDRRASEDAYAWMLYSVKGAYFYFTDEITNLYRIPQDVQGSISRSTVGQENFYKELARTNEEAFLYCLDYVQKQNRLDDKEREELLKGFYKCLSRTLYGEGMKSLGDQYISLSK